jgi:hypothetical protein
VPDPVKLICWQLQVWRIVKKSPETFVKRLFISPEQVCRGYIDYGNQAVQFCISRCTFRTLVNVNSTLVLGNDMIKRRVFFF